ncbi:MAG: hypothetical protein J1F09_02790 [Oscillospiraceae bacterium]|nr:hypothetical protein [Oscillospiraceae bacterium]
MSKKNKNSPREKHNEEIINELFGSEGETPDIETDITDLGQQPEEDVKVARIPAKQKFYFGFAIFIVVMAVVGFGTCIRFSVVGVKALVENTSLKNEFTRFILPAVATDISPYQNESEIPNSVKINCSIWHILLEENYADYRSDVAGEYLIPEYDVGVACKALFGGDSTLDHQTVGYGEARFTYDAERHVYSCPRSLRNLSYAPRITDMSINDGVYVLRVEYLPPSISMVADNLGVETDPDKIMEYTISRVDKKNTLVSVKFLELGR